MLKSTTLTFQNYTMPILEKDGQIWVTSSDIANALGYKHPNRVSEMYNRHKDEFTAKMTELRKMRMSGNLETEQRIFTLRGVHLIAMLSHTKVAKAFRKWVLDLIEQQDIAIPAPQKPVQQQLPLASGMDYKTSVSFLLLALNVGMNTNRELANILSVQRQLQSLPQTKHTAEQRASGYANLCDHITKQREGMKEWADQVINVIKSKASPEEQKALLRIYHH